MISYTAQIIAGRRALCTEQGSKYIHDPYAHLFISDEIRARVIETDAPVHGILLRNRLYEDYTISPPQEIKQIILIGAGLDCKYQKHQSLQNKLYIEVDDPEMTAFKKEILEKNQLPVPDMIEKRIESLDDIKAILTKTDPKLPTLIMAEGFLMYQPQNFAFEIIETCLDYYDQTPCFGFDVLDADQKRSAESLASIKRINKKGEYFSAEHSEAQIKKFLSEYPLKFQFWRAFDTQKHYLGIESPLDLPVLICFCYPSHLNWYPPRS